MKIIIGECSFCGMAISLTTPRNEIVFKGNWPKVSFTCCERCSSSVCQYLEELANTLLETRMQIKARSLAACNEALKIGLDYPTHIAAVIDAREAGHD